MPRVGVIVSWINSLSRRLEEATENLDELKDKVEELNERFEKLDDEVYGIKNNRKRTFCDE